MENVDAPPLSTPQSADADPDRTSAASSNESSCEEYPPSESPTALETPHRILHLIQCQRCSRPLHTPLRLPCGNTICRSCLPPLRPRTGITYPVAEGREEGFTCHWAGTNDCVGEHCLGDCGVDVVLCNLLGIFQEELGFPTPESDRLDEADDGGRIVSWTVSPETVDPPSVKNARLYRRGWLCGLYLLAWEGRFPNNAMDVLYEPSNDPAEEQVCQQDDHTRYGQLRDRVRGEVDCQVCYSLILDPLTTPCGHTFCRKCVARILDHTDLCPVCRRKVGMPTAVRSEPLNRTIARIIDHFFADQVVSRREADADDELGGDHEKDLPLFVCTLSFPTMPTFLHIFEPRYRLMIRRVVENGNSKFGMVMYNRRGDPQGDGLGSTMFMQYGTVLRVERYELLPDGRSLVIATGVSRFKILEAGELDGYLVARTERVDDVSVAEEERLEALETATAAIADPSDANASEPPLNSLSTQELLEVSREFVRTQRLANAPWLHPRVMLTYGPVPTDAARFAWWFASILPVADEEKYLLLSARSVRERLKISARWARELGSRDWSSHSSFSSVL